MGSGIRAPSRISGIGYQGLPSKSSANKNWQLKATYVEVRGRRVEHPVYAC
jgi:kinesin family protein 4/21/27